MNSKSRKQSDRWIDVDFLRTARWFQHKGEVIHGASERERIACGDGLALGIFSIQLAGQGSAEDYLLPIVRNLPQSNDTAFVEVIRCLWKRWLNGGREKTRGGEVQFYNFLVPPHSTDDVEIELLTEGSSNTLLRLHACGQEYFLKILRRLRPGKNVEFEVNRFLTQQTSFNQMPQLRGALTYTDANDKTYHLASFFDYLPHQGSGWTFALEQLKLSFQDFGQRGGCKDSNDLVPSGSLNWAVELGRGLANLHRALSKGSPPFAPQEVTTTSVQELQRLLLKQAGRTFAVIEKERGKFPELANLWKQSGKIINLLQRSAEIFQRWGFFIRQHGDFHLGQVMPARPKWLIVDFEGEPLKPYAERETFYPAVKDVAGMLRSFNYAAFTAHFTWRQEGANIFSPKADKIGKLCAEWERAVSQMFLDAYYHELKETRAAFIPWNDIEAMRYGLAIMTLEKALYEIEYEAGNRPDWLIIPVGGALKIMEDLK